ncbi:hypothetical protein [Bifidobacterium leontopitheci]|uniref:Uncharacterized protein n=1 Tax=Bifidobacterium leontopitheci TaxID=2650774 RepID=A0A6I1GHZ6_9BIFI|nr:hypothetical protein [Bifidobacterium leontopitheci]KAB7790282.1 hypothetical protein F7D09_1178 [Bifidobacterium leontopitheci]
MTYPSMSSNPATQAYAGPQSPATPPKSAKDVERQWKHRFTIGSIITLVGIVATAVGVFLPAWTISGPADLIKTAMSNLSSDDKAFVDLVQDNTSIRMTMTGRFTVPFWVFMALLAVILLFTLLRLHIPTLVFSIIMTLWIGVFAGFTWYADNRLSSLISKADAGDIGSIIQHGLSYGLMIMVAGTLLMVAGSIVSLVRRGQLRRKTLNALAAGQQAPAAFGGQPSYAAAAPAPQADWQAAPATQPVATWQSPAAQPSPFMPQTPGIPVQGQAAPAPGPMPAAGGQSMPSIPLPPKR